MPVKEIKSAVIINFKRVKGRPAIDLAEKLNELEDRLAEKYDIALALQVPDAIEICSQCKFKIFMQDTFSDEEHCFLTYFKNKSYIDPRITGIILNHPEIKLPNTLLMENIRKAEDLNIQKIICAASIEEAYEVDRLLPHYIGLENEALIGKDISFMDHCPEILQQAKAKLNNSILIGAGIKGARDIKHVINAGGAGILISSLILRSADPVDTLSNLLY